MRTRREFIKSAAVAAGAAACRSSLIAAQPSSNLNVGIVGAGLAGLSCGYELKTAGILATIYEARTEAGGRCSSMSFYGQTIERGGELIDTAHKMMIGYARKFGLTLESYIKPPGDIFYYFNSALHPEREIVDQFRAFVPAMQTDLRAISSAPTADSHTPTDIALDNMSLAEYLVSRGAPPLLYKVIEQAYISEYGREIAEQSCLNFLLYMRADRRSRFQPYGSSDQRYHIVEGNQQVAFGLEQRLQNQIQKGKELVAIKKRSDGRIELYFSGQATPSVHDVAVITIPFTILRNVSLDASLGIPGWKLDAIQNLGYGDNAKMMVGFAGRPWLADGSNGSAYTDLPNVQNTWETDPARATATSAVLTDYSGGNRGKNLNPANPQGEAALWLGDLNVVYPGALAAADQAKMNGDYRVLLQHWPSNPFTRGSYTCYLPGQFTTIAGNEVKPIDNLLFAGEHTDSFYNFQGFMEGALESGVAAAQLILKPGKH